MPRTAAAALAVAGLACLPGGCRRAPAPDLDLTTELAALTNLTLFAVTPAGLPEMAAGVVGPEEAQALIAGEWLEIASFEGPGCIRRIWSDAPAGLRWRFFFDGEPEPRLDIDGDALFGVAGRTPFLHPVADSAGGGRVSYVPMPYAGALRIFVGGAADAAELAGVAFQINASAYSPGSREVASFPEIPDARELAQLAEVRAVWLNTDPELRAAAAACGPERIVRLEAGESAEWLAARGPGTVRAFRLRPVFPEDAGPLARARALRALVLRFYWDGAGRPSVDVPLGVFFANAWRSRRFASLPLGRVGEDYICRLPMPFQDAARAELRNDGPLPVRVHAAAWVEHGRMPPAQRNYFHAEQRVLRGPDEVFRAFSDGGSGHLAGVVLTAAGLSDEWSIFDGRHEAVASDPGAPFWRGAGGLAATFNGGGHYTGLFDRPLAGLVEKAPIRTQQYRWFLPERPVYSEGIDFHWYFDANAPRDLAALFFWYRPRVRPVAGPPPWQERSVAGDPLERDAIMCALFELERIGHFDEARDLAIEYYEKYPDLTATDFIRVRILGYEELIAGREGVRAIYRDIAARIGGAGQLGRELERLLWFQAETDRGLMATQINGRFRAYFNGERIEQGDNPTVLVARPVTLRDGPNEISVKVIPNKPDAWISLVLRTHASDIVSGTDWEYARRRPSDWPATDCPQTHWQPVAESAQLPLPRWWRIHPNIFVNMQSGSQLARPWIGPGWTEPPYEETFFRKRFDFESARAPEGE